MALTVKNKEYTVFGNKRVMFFEVDFDDAYPTGGEELKPATLGLRRFDFVNVTNKGGYTFDFDYTNNKIVVRNISDGNEVSNGTDLSSLTGVKVMVIGI